MKGRGEGWREGLWVERGGGEGKGRVRFISCALWILMMVLLRVTVGCGNADFLKGEGQKVSTHTAATHQRVCACSFAHPHVCACARARQHCASEQLVTISSEVSTPISHQSEVGLKTQIQFPLLYFEV